MTDRTIPAAWVARLRALTGSELDDVRWNETVGRYEFILREADGVPRSQFWGWFADPRTGLPIPPDEVTGLPPYRALDEAAFTEALANLERTFIGNRWDGDGTPRRRVRNRMRRNREMKRAHYRRAAEAFADMAGERARRIRGGLLVPVASPKEG